MELLLRMTTVKKSDASFWQRPDRSGVRGPLMKGAGHAGCECHALVTPGALHGASEKILIEVCFGSSWQ